MDCLRSMICLSNLAVGPLAFGSIETTDPNGINSSGLAFTGSGIAIGQVEPGRPGRPGFDTMPGNLNPFIIPAGVFVKDGAATADTNVVPHAEQVAGVMISTDPNDDDADTDIPIGVAVDAELYSSAYVTGGASVASYTDALLAVQNVATQNGGDVRAINHSWGKPLLPGAKLNGSSQLTLGFDWSASAHDVLHVVAGNEDSGGIPVPTDDFNGITVGFTRKIGGVFREVDPANFFMEDAVGLRTSIDILAPGRDVELAGLGGSESDNSGTSFAAPHVTGTVALLQEFADGRITAGATGWDSDARRHEVMKAVLMNSADKIEDTSGTGVLLGMEKTILDKAGDTWLDSEAFFNTQRPLDNEMGAGQLNAKRAVQQFQPGEFDSVSGLNSVEPIGWDYGRTDFNGDFNRYLINTPLTAGNYISVTLAWDREVDKTGDPNEFVAGDTFDVPSDPNTSDDIINDLDIFLVPLDSFVPERESISFEGSLEHLFTQVPFDGEWEIWVQQQDGDVAGGQDYGLAWWYGLAPELEVPGPGDFDGDGDVDGEDLAQWEGSYALNDGADADNDGDSDGVDFLIWQRNFGTGVLSAATALPEPGTGALALMGMVLALRQAQGRRRVACPRPRGHVNRRKDMPTSADLRGHATRHTQTAGRPTL